MRLVTSGGFDPLHSGHIAFFRETLDMFPNNRLLVLLNSDEWLIQKKGYFFAPFQERKFQLLSFDKRIEVLQAITDEDGTVCPHLITLREYSLEDMIFVKGGDRYVANIPEWKVCQDNNIKLLVGIAGYKKEQSSSTLVANFLDRIKNG